MFVARKSNHIQEDQKRNWSSWNFGEGGFVGSELDLKNYLSQASDENALWISGFEIFPDSIKDFSFGELYPNYWVAIDNVNAPNGLSCIFLDAEDLNSAIKEAESRTDYWGDGQSFNATEANLVYSNNDIHVFEISE